MNRVFLVVLDSVGIGALPDASLYGDEKSNTLLSISRSERFSVPSLRKMGLYNIDGVKGGKKEAAPVASYGRLAERSSGKDTTTGHWEMAGIVSEKPLPLFPNGFPEELIEAFEKKTGRKVLCNKAYSGTDVIRDYGREHIETGALIVYTSADSVFQIAAHEDVIGVELLYEYCRMARELLTGPYGVGRVIARPFTGEYPNFTRTGNRHDFSLCPPQATVLNALKDNGYSVLGIGKINDIFAGQGITESFKTKNNLDGMLRTIELTKRAFVGLCFVNLVDFDMLYGHRNDVDGYATALSEFDFHLNRLTKMLEKEDILIITADHGCDPASKSTDHSREYVPLLVYGEGIKQGVNLGTIDGFTAIGATIADYFGLSWKCEGESFYENIRYNS